MDPRQLSNPMNMSDMSPEERRRLKAKEFFGVEITPPLEQDQKESDTQTKIQSFVPPISEDEGETVISSGGSFAQTIDVRGDSFTNDRDLIVKYRNAAMQPECDSAIDDIVNEAIVSNDEDLPVELVLDHCDITDKVKEALLKEFDETLRMLDFRRYGHDIFRRWYIDGRVIYHMVVDLNNPRRGVVELRPVNPIKIKKIREVQEEIDPRTGAKMISSSEEYFVYSDDGFNASANQSRMTASGISTIGLKIPTDSVVYVTSGMTDTTRRVPLSHLHKALRPVNQLRMMEDALVIYRLSRAPERRLFYVDIGNLPAAKAEEYMNGLMNKYRNKLTYNAQTGEIQDGTKHMSMLEDFWLPRREGGRGTEISNLPGGQNLGEIEDIEYFQRKLYQSLSVPLSRMESGSPFNIGRSSEIARDELKFQKFIDRMRIKFSELFKQVLRTQAILKKILTSDEWDSIAEDLIIDYARDSYFAEFKNMEMLRERLQTLESVQSYVGEYYSKEWVRKNILQQSEEEIKQMKEEIRSEALDNDQLPNPERDVGDMAPGFGGEFGGGGGLPPDGGGFRGEDEFGGPGSEFGADEFESNADIPLGAPEGAATALGPQDEANPLDIEDNDDDEDNLPPLPGRPGR